MLLFAWVILTVLAGYYRHEGLLVLYAAIVGLYTWYLDEQDRMPGG